MIGIKGDGKFYYTKPFIRTLLFDSPNGVHVAFILIRIADKMCYTCAKKATESINISPKSGKTQEEIWKIPLDKFHNK